MNQGTYIFAIIALIGALIMLGMVIYVANTGKFEKILRRLFVLTLLGVIGVSARTVYQIHYDNLPQKVMVYSPDGKVSARYVGYHVVANAEDTVRYNGKVTTIPSKNGEAYVTFSTSPASSVGVTIPADKGGKITIGHK